MGMRSFDPTCDDIRPRIITNNDLAFAFPTNLPIVPGHTLVSPFRVVPSLDALTNDELLAIHALRRQVCCALRDVVGAEGFNYAICEGPIAGQSVDHVHLHIVPRKLGDYDLRQVDPRAFLYRPGSRAQSPMEELIDIAEKLRMYLPREP